MTLLTSLSEEDLAKIPSGGKRFSVNMFFNTWPYRLKISGLDGVVCSAQEAAWVREVCGENFLVVTPGIRLTGSSNDDQSRIVTPSNALRQGADYLVVGRPITHAPDPLAAARQMIVEMKKAFV